MAARNSQDVDEFLLWFRGNASAELTTAVLGCAAMKESVLAVLYAANCVWGNADDDREMRLSLARDILSLPEAPELVDLDFIDGSVGKVRRHEISEQAQSLNVLVWGALRAAGGGNRSLRELYSIYYTVLYYSADREFLQRHGQSGRLANVIWYIHEHPEVLLERSSGGETLLLEASRRDQGLFHFVMTTYHARLVPLDTMNDFGDSAAMLLSLGRLGLRDPNVELLEGWTRQQELRRISWLFHYPYKSCVVLGVHLAIVALAGCFLPCRPKFSLDQCESIVCFASQVAILSMVNFLVQYGSHPEVMLRWDIIMNVTWNTNVIRSWPIMAVLIMGFLSVYLHDFISACTRASSHWEKLFGDGMRASTIYEDPRVPTIHCIHTFLLSSVYIAFFMSTLLEPLHMTLFSKAMWAGAFFVQMYICTFSTWAQRPSLSYFYRWTFRLEDQENAELWAALLRQDNLQDSHGDTAIPRLGKVEVWLRFTMLYVANGLYQIITVYLLPCYLAAQHSPCDFALNAFVVTFIYQIDGLPGGAEFTVDRESEAELTADREHAVRFASDAEAFASDLVVASETEASRASSAA